MPAKWERAYVGAINVLLAAAAILLFWDAATTGGWRIRLAFVFLIGWVVALRLGAKWMPSKVSASVENWQARGRLYELCFNLLWIGLPLSIFGYLARVHSPWELITVTLFLSLLRLLFTRSQSSKSKSNIPVRSA